MSKIARRVALAAGVLVLVPMVQPVPGSAAAAAYHRAMEKLGRTLLHALARGLGLPETAFDAAFADGVSTLRLIRYPERPTASFHDNERPARVKGRSAQYRSAP